MKTKQISIATTTLFYYFGSNWFKLSENRMLKVAEDIGGIAENEIVASIDIVKQYQTDLRANKKHRRTRVSDDELIELCRTALANGWSYQTFLSMLPCGISTLKDHAKQNKKLKRLKDQIPRGDQSLQTVVLYPDSHLEFYASRRKAAEATGVPADTVTKICNHKRISNAIDGFRFKDHDEWLTEGF